MTSKEKFDLYFPGEQIPASCHEPVKFFDHHAYDFKYGGIQPVPMDKLVGTNHPSYGGKVSSWLDMLNYLKRRDSSNYKYSQISNILAAPTDNILLAYLLNFDEYYIFSGGNHRLTFHKLSGISHINLFVTIGTERMLGGKTFVTRH